MAVLIIIGAGLIGAIVVVALLYRFKSAVGSQSSEVEAIVAKELGAKQELVAKLRALYSTMVDTNSARNKIREIKALQETLKAERGRITITQAELETVETRLRELEEIERELEASGLETKEELTILEKKQRELVGKNDALKTKIADSAQQWEQLLKEIESNSQLFERAQAAKMELITTEERISTLMLQIEQGNEQYFILKRRYDALDIEYAQLYEKFSESEQAVTSARDKQS
jgi:chromosome segregation ATPase